MVIMDKRHRQTVNQAQRRRSLLYWKDLLDGECDDSKDWQADSQQTYRNRHRPKTAWNEVEDRR